jgi:hypothetical protein
MKYKAPSNIRIERLLNNSQEFKNNNSSVHFNQIEIKKKTKSLFESTFHHTKEFIEAAIEYENNQVTPYEALCLKKPTYKQNSYLFRLLVILIFVIINVFIGASLIVIRNLNFLGILLMGELIVLLSLFWFEKNPFDKEDELYDQFLLHAKKEYRDFLRIFENHPNLPILGLNYFRYNSPLSYKLFNLVTTFAFNSFTLADTQDNEEALIEILQPMVTDIIQEAIDNYKVFLNIEMDVADNEARQLQSQVELDMHAYNNRMFKK